jgi:hypothetical protein
LPQVSGFGVPTVMVRQYGAESLEIGAGVVRRAMASAGGHGAAQDVSLSKSTTGSTPGQPYRNARPVTWKNGGGGGTGPPAHPTPKRK